MTMIVKLLKHQFKFDSVYTPIFGDESEGSTLQTMSFLFKGFTKTC